MRLQLTTDTEPVEIELEELKAQIAAGRVPPKALIQCRVLTNDEWWPMEDLNIFHKYCPVEHPRGPRLVARLERERARAEKEKEKQDQMFKEMLALEGAITEGTLMHDSYELADLSQIVTAPGVSGATRLIVLPSFAGEVVLTFVCVGSSVEIEIAERELSTWYTSMAQSLAPKDNPELADRVVELSKVKKKKATLDLEQLPEGARAWSTFVSIAESAGDYTFQLAPDIAMMDGTGYRHQVRNGKTIMDVEWSNLQGDIPQVRLIDTYDEWCGLAGLS